MYLDKMFTRFFRFFLNQSHLQTCTQFTFLVQCVPNVVVFNLCCSLLGWEVGVNKRRKLYLPRATPYCITQLEPTTKSYWNRPPSHSPSSYANRVAFRIIVISMLL